MRLIVWCLKKNVSIVFYKWHLLVFNGKSRQFISIMISNIACMDKRLYNKYKDTTTNTDDTNNNFLHTCISDGSSLTFWAIAVFLFILHNYFLLSWSFFISLVTKLLQTFFIRENKKLYLTFERKLSEHCLQLYSYYVYIKDAFHTM